MLNTMAYNVHSVIPFIPQLNNTNQLLILKTIVFLFFLVRCFHCLVKCQILKCDFVNTRDARAIQRENSRLSHIHVI